MMIYYSASNNAFYDTAIHGALFDEENNRNANIPLDVVEITKQQHDDLLDAQAQGLIIKSDANGLPVAEQKPELPLEQRKANAKNAIDAAAGEARKRFVSDGALVEEEYRYAKRKVDEWRANGSDVNSAPSCVVVWATVSGMTVDEAAVNIETTADLFDSVIESIRAIRLTGKSAIDTATESTLDDVLSGCIAQLDAITP